MRKSDSDEIFLKCRLLVWLSNWLYMSFGDWKQSSWGFFGGSIGTSENSCGFEQK
jgi:hypothetical protein